MSRLDESEVPACWDQPTENVRLRIYIAIPICTFFQTQQIRTNLHYACKNQWTLPWKVQALRESCNLDATVTFTPWRNPALMALHSRNVQGNLTKFWWSNTNSRKVKHKGKFARPIAHRSLHCARMVLVKVPLFKEKTDNLKKNNPNFEWNPLSQTQKNANQTMSNYRFCVIGWELVEEQARIDKHKIFRLFYFMWMPQFVQVPCLKGFSPTSETGTCARWRCWHVFLAKTNSVRRAKTWLKQHARRTSRVTIPINLDCIAFKFVQNVVPEITQWFKI